PVCCALIEQSAARAERFGFLQLRGADRWTRPFRTAAISPLRQRLIDDMNMRRFSRATQHSYIRDVGRFATFLRRSPDTATADDVRRFQIEQRDAGVPTPTMNSIVSALRFFFTHTIDRPDLAR